MKKIFFIIILFLSIQSLLAQSSFSEIKKHHSWAWLGLDFSNTKLLGRAAFSDPEKIINEYFPKINMLVFDEADKYDVMRSFRMKNLYADDLYCDILNSSLSTDELFVGRDYSLEKSDILNIVAKYNFDKVKQDIALIFIIESLDKTGERATMWVTVINTKTKDLLLSERMTGKPGGFGFRNYWAKSVYNVLKDIYKKKYKRWKKM
jgi:hypothetical protein